MSQASSLLGSPMSIMMTDPVSFEERLSAIITERRARLEKLVTACVGLLMLAMIWMMIPDLEASMVGSDPLLPELGPALLMLAWVFFLQDLIDDGPVANSRIGAAASVMWLPLMVIGCWTLNDSLGPLIGGLGLMAVGAILYRESRIRLTGGWEATRYRAVMGGIGLVMALSFFVVDVPQGSVLLVNSTLLLAAVGFIIQDSIGGDEDRDLRKEFRKKLDSTENRLLELKAEGVAVDQASSLITTASEEGHLDPKTGMRLLHEALDDIERTIAFADDVEAIKADAESAVDEAENIAPQARRPRSAFVQGDREVELGSLREGEMLYRQAKKRAADIIEWWHKAEVVIGEAKRLIDDLEGEQGRHLREILTEAKECLEAEDAKKAWELASVIPQQAEAVGEAVENADAAVEEAQRVLEGVDGLDTTPWVERMESAKVALSKGNHALARGLSDGVVREIGQEREAMEDVRRAMRQRNKLKKRWEDRPDSKDWQIRYDELEKAADELQWSHAATLLERLTKDLDKEADSAGEAAELLQFVQTEWSTLRNQLEASMIKVEDDERRRCEVAVGEATEAHSKSQWKDCLTALSKADDLMERLRRRV
ncbi:MAG: hypothetical protein QF707_07595 [Candidatus Poseidoniaceae archaeon]|nr:hypothetical protein [Candidatus Poseidoniaceae archaeon]